MAKSTREGQSGADNATTAEPGGKAMMDASSGVAAGLQDIAQAWADYAQQMMERTTEGTQALLKCRTFNDMLGVQAELMRGHLQAFLNQSTRLAEISNRMAARSIDAIRAAGGDASADKSRR
ncbi:MAG TPA: phasin family protein [Stellaceae bacterium]|nr:phasin family protein [Stellaceae bacterium]